MINSCHVLHDVGFFSETAIKCLKEGTGNTHCSAKNVATHLHTSGTSNTSVKGWSCKKKNGESFIRAGSPQSKLNAIE